MRNFKNSTITSFTNLLAYIIITTSLANAPTLSSRAVPTLFLHILNAVLVEDKIIIEAKKVAINCTSRHALASALNENSVKVLPLMRK